MNGGTWFIRNNGIERPFRQRGVREGHQSPERTEDSERDRRPQDIATSFHGDDLVAVQSWSSFVATVHVLREVRRSAGAPGPERKLAA